MEKLEDNSEVRKIIERRTPQPSLDDISQDLMKELDIRTPADLFSAIDTIRRLWMEDKFDTYQRDYEE